MNRHLLVLPEFSALLAVISTPTSAPLIAATRLGKGSTNSARSAARLLSDALATARRAGVAGLVIARAAGARGGDRYTRTRTSPVRAQLINLLGRIAHSAHRQVVHLPRGWPCADGLDELFRRERDTEDRRWIETEATEIILC